MELITNTQADAMEQLARFKFLSTSQVQRLCGKSLGYIREQLKSLSTRGYIASYNLEKTGRAEYIYYLTEKGKHLLLSHHKDFTEDIRLPIGEPLVVRDTKHRVNFIDLHIDCYGYMAKHGHEIELFHAYFDKTGNNRTGANLESKVRIDLGNGQFYMPDGIMVTSEGEDKKLYLIEMYNGRDTGRVLRALAAHCRGIALGTPAKKYGLQINPIVLCAFEFENAKQAVVKKLQTNEKFMPMRQFFHFATLSDINKDFATAWQNFMDVKIFQA